jgi:hypothetical protein
MYQTIASKFIANNPVKSTPKHQAQTYLYMYENLHTIEFLKL